MGPSTVPWGTLEVTAIFSNEVPHKRLVSKLKYYGISDQITIWITSFLANRTQTVHLENTTSEKIAV
jgi:hypothetical protein